MGRKRLEDEDRREKPLRVRLTPAEREIIDAAAESAGVKTSEWARTAMLSVAQKQQKRLPK